MNETEGRCEHFGRFVPVGSEPHHCLPDQLSSKRVSFPESEKSPEENEHCSCHIVEKTEPTDVPEPPQIEKKFTSDFDENRLGLSEYQRADESENPPCYLPQPDDKEPKKDYATVGDSLGPWATGKVDWSPMAGITGIRPIIDRYSITRYSPGEWRQHNKELLTKTYEAYENSQINHHNCKSIKSKVYDLIDKNQSESNKRIKDRAKLIEKWKHTLERAIKAHIDEITILEQERLRVKRSLAILNLPKSIASECLEKRATRQESELVRDEPEEQLIKEMALIEEIQMILNKTLADIEQQQTENRAARQRLEYDWSDKQDAYRIECTNIALDNLSTTTLFKPGSTKFPADQSSEEYWEHFTKETLEECGKCRQKSVKLRGTLNEILMNVARDLRIQAEAVEKALAKRISCIQEILTRLENELRECLRKLADTENRIKKMKEDTQRLDSAMKVAQTRLDNRHNREHVENCRDYALKGLIEEVKIIQEGVAAMLASTNEAEKVKEQLITTRINLEKEIMLKRHTIMIDKERCIWLRSHFPSAAALSGFSNI